LAGVFHDLIARDFDNQQAVLTAEWNRFPTVVFSHVAVLNAAHPIPALHSLVVAYHSTL
jgi:hypothetical protein